jgi:alkylation response protein AidB-like acyl-CoA dehydrogenase
VTFPPVSLGLVAAALDHATDVARRRTPFASSTTLRHRHPAQAAFGRALAGYRAARAFYHQTIRDGFQRAANGGEFALTDKADLFLACAQTLQSCADVARLLARAVGTSAIYQGNPIERALRDTEVIAQHAFGAEARFASVAQVYWDAELDFPLLGMD